MTASVNPVMLSLLMADLSSGPADVEGVLMGSISRTRTTRAQDDGDPVVVDTVNIRIDGYHTLKVGDVVEMDHGIISSQHHCINPKFLSPEFKGRIVGWYRFESEHSKMMVPSIEDRVRHEAVRDLVAENDKPWIVYLLIRETRNQEFPEAVKGFIRTVYRINPSSELQHNVTLEKVPLRIKNLGSTDATHRYVTPPLSTTDRPSTAPPSPSSGQRREKSLKAQEAINSLIPEEFSRSLKETEEAVKRFAINYENGEGQLLRRIRDMENKILSLRAARIKKEKNNSTLPVSNPDDVVNIFKSAADTSTGESSTRDTSTRDISTRSTVSMTPSAGGDEHFVIPDTQEVEDEGSWSDGGNGESGNDAENWMDVEDDVLGRENLDALLAPDKKGGDKGGRREVEEKDKDKDGKRGGKDEVELEVDPKEDENGNQKAKNLASGRISARAKLRRGAKDNEEEEKEKEEEEENAPKKSRTMRARSPRL